MFEFLKLNIDKRFRKKNFAKNVFDGIRTQLLESAEYLEAHIERLQKDRDEEVELWTDRHKRLGDRYRDLESYGYKNRKEYFDSPWSGDDHTDMKLLDIINDINRLSITEEVEADYVSTLNKYQVEIDASQEVLQKIESILPRFSQASVKSLEEIDHLFTEHGCEQLLNMPGIIDVPLLTIVLFPDS